MSVKCDIFEVLEWATNQPDLAAAEARILSILVRHVNLQTLECFPSLKRLSAMTGTSKPAVHRQLKALCNRQLIEKLGSSQPIRYKLLVPVDTTAQDINRMTYAEYLKSGHWKELRKRRLKLDKYSCQLCATKDGLHVHHKHYRGGLAQTKLEDLITLCKDCHAKHHGKDAKPRMRLVWDGEGYKLEGGNG